MSEKVNEEYQHATVVWIIFGLAALFGGVYFLYNAVPVDINNDIETVSGEISNSPKLQSAGGRTLAKKMEIELQNDSRTFNLSQVMIDQIEGHLYQLKKGTYVSIVCFKKDSKPLSDGSHNDIYGLSINKLKVLDEQENIPNNPDQGIGFGWILISIFCFILSKVFYRTHKKITYT